MRKTVMVGKGLTHKEAIRKAQVNPKEVNATYNPKTGKLTLVL